MNNTGRVLTLKVVITDPEAADWIWRSYHNPNHGIQVLELADGDLMSERDVFKNAASFYIREEDESTEDAVKAHFDEPFNCPHEAARAALDNVGEGAKWDIVDARGNVVRSSK